MRRFHLPFGVKVFVLVWALVLLVPQLHESFEAQRYIAGQGTPSVDAQKMAKRFPDDPRILAFQIEQDYSDVASETVRLHDKLDRFDALIRRFPRENWLRAKLIGLLMGKSIDMDFEGAPARQKKRVADVSALQKGLRCAVEAQKVEPDNAFFPWMEAIFCFGLGANEMGVKALEKAARAKGCNDYLQQGVRQNLAIFSLDRPLLFEEKMGVGYGGLYLYFSKMQGARKAALQLALEAQKRGDNQRALRIIGAILGATQVFRSHAETLLNLLIGDRMTRETLEKINVTQGFKIQKTGDMSMEERRAYTMQLACDFGQYARRFGRDDIARRTQVQAMAPAPMTALWTAEPWDNWGMDAPWGRVAFQANWFIEQMGHFSLAFALIWSLSSAYLVYRGRKDKEVAQKGIPTRGQVAFCANFSVWALIGFGALATIFGVGFLFGSVGWVQSLDSGTNEIINAFLTKSALYVALAFWLLPVVLALVARSWKWRRSDKPLGVRHRLSPQKLWIRCGLWGLALAFGLTTFSNAGGMWDDTIFQWLVSPLLSKVFLVLALSFELYHSRWVRQLKRVRVEKKPQSNRWLYAVRLGGSSAGVLAVVWSLFLLMGGLGLWPLRAKLNYAIEKQIEVGEIEWMRQEMTRKEGNANVR